MEGENSKTTAIVSRDKVIIKTSIIGIIVNVLLSVFKAMIGILSNSIAVVLDAVNNLSDALSSVLTIIGTKLAHKLPDRKHPLGYGRIEYLTSMIVSGIVLYAGITSAIESVKKIIHPEQADYDVISLIIIAVAVVAKLVLGKYVKTQGKKVSSGSLIASGSDATFDAVLSASVLGSALVYLAFGVSLEAYVGAVLSIIIIKSGIEMMIETLNAILGNRPEKELTDQVKQILCEDPAVKGAYDLVVNNYGPDRNYASVHLELPDTMTVAEVDLLTRNAELRVYQKTGVLLTGVGVYSYNTSNHEAAQIENHVRKIVMKHDWVLQMHGFYLEPQIKQIRFDAVMSFEIKYKDGLAILQKELAQAFPDYTILIAPDVDLYDI